MKTEKLCLEGYDCLCNLALNQLPIYVFWKNEDLVFQGCNENFAKLVGLKDASEIVGKTDFDFVNKKTAEHFREVDRAVIEKRQPISGATEKATDLKHNEIWIQVNKVPLIKDDKVMGILGVFEDITEKKMLEGQLTKSEEKYKNLIEFTNTSYLIMDDKLKITDANKNFCKLMEVGNKDKIIGYNLRTWVCSNQMSVFDNAFSCLLKGKKIINDLELSLSNENGNKVHVSVNANLTKNGETKIFCLMSDISHRKMLEQVEYVKKQKQKDRIKKNILDIKKELESLGK